MGTLFDREIALIHRFLGYPRLVCEGPRELDGLARASYQRPPFCGTSSVVERLVANEEVVSSNLMSRSRIFSFYGALTGQVWSGFAA